MLETPNSGYYDLAEFLTVAAENQLALEAGGELAEIDGQPSDSIALDPGIGASSDRRSVKSLLRRPEGAPEVLRSASPGERALFVLTNRVSPMTLGVRVLANMTLGDGPPTVAEFVGEAAQLARLVGLRLRDEDRAAGARGLQRRSVGWPIGDDEEKSRSRFQFSFLVEETGGPMADLGFAAVEDGRILITDVGLTLAECPSPVLGEADGWTLGEEQQRIVRAAVLSMAGEAAEVRMFLRAVEDEDGEQPRVDALIQQAKPDWTANRVTAHRAALVGRLREMGVVEVVGWGVSARIKSLDPADEFTTSAGANEGGTR